MLTPIFNIIKNKHSYLDQKEVIDIGVKRMLTVIPTYFK